MIHFLQYFKYYAQPLSVLLQCKNCINIFPGVESGPVLPVPQFRKPQNSDITKVTNELCTFRTKTFA